MTRNTRPCAAPPTSCGTAAGWRRGGRCWRCRIAHNAETKRYRGLSEGQRADFLASVNAGQNVEVAAAHAGVSLQKLVRSASTDGALRAALDEQPPAVQKAAQMGDYLAALTRTGGSVELARMTTGLPKNSLQNYREQEPEFAAAEKAVIQWLESANAKTVRGLSGARLTQAARLLERGASITEAAKAVNTSVSALRYASARHPFLASVLPQPITRGSETRTPERIAQLRRLWASSDKSEREIAEELGVAKNTVVSWARDLSLPTRRASGTDR